MKDKTVYTCTYKSKLGDILLAADAIGLTGLWFEGQKYFANTLPDGAISQESPILTEAKRWLDIYFSGKEPDLFRRCIRLAPHFDRRCGRFYCKFRMDRRLPMGRLQKKLAKMQNASHMSAQAVGGAVGHNEISIIIPCHRVVGTNGSLTGYAGGIEKKIGLLKLEQTDMSGMFVPKRGTAL